MKKLIFAVMLLFAAANVQAQCDTQAYNKLIKEGENAEKNQNYELAVRKYSAAMIICPDKAETPQDKIVQVFRKIEKLKQDAENAKNEALKQTEIANAEKQRALVALEKAEEMQKKVETAMFDKAVKERNKDWKGYANYDWSEDYFLDTDGLEILNKIDSLDLSSNALLRVLQEISQCPNLKHINLLYNNEIDWTDCFEKIRKNKNINSVYVSVYDLDSIPTEHWHLITGIEILKNELTEIPQNILQQTQLTYLDLRAGYGEYNQFSNLNEIYKLRNLKYLVIVNK